MEEFCHNVLTTMSAATTGSFLQHWNRKDDQPTVADMAWDDHIGSASKFLRLAQTRSFELRLLNEIWGRWFVKEMLRKYGMVQSSPVHLCQTGLLSRKES